MGIINFEAFLFASILLNLTPGADTMYILGRSISQGKKAGLLSAVGIGTGALVHCVFAVLGLSLIIAKSSLAFQTVKYAGAAYLIFLGIKMLISKQDKGMDIEKSTNAHSLRKIYFSGILTNVLNPKVALFFLAFLPQFVDQKEIGSPYPFLLLGMTFVATGTLWCLILAFFSSKLSDKIRENYGIKKWLDRITGGIFVALGVKLALSEK
ncbi:LysE family translocator [Echinicola sediminis]